MSAGSATAWCTCATAPRPEQTAAAPGRGAVGAHMRVAWDRRPSAAGGEQDSLAQQGDGSVRCGGLQPFSDRGSPTIGSRRVGGGASLWPSRVLLDQLRRLDQVSSANAWIPAGRVLVPHHSRPRRSRRAGGAVSGWSLSRGGELEDHSQVRQPAEENTLVKQGSAYFARRISLPPDGQFAVPHPRASLKTAIYLHISFPPC
jgi:hypothetical protein